MKKILILFVMAFAVNTYAQETTLLRLKYQKGDMYETVIKQSVASPQMMMDMTMTSEVKITDSNAKNFSSETKFSKIVMDMMQGEMAFSYDSSKSDDELDEVGMMLKGQMGPILESVIYSKGDVFGNVLEAKAEPSFQGSENVGESNIVYPENAVKVGDTFTMEKENNGMKLNFTFEVTSMTSKLVGLSIKGSVAGAGGDIKGTMSVDRATGVTLNSDITTKIDQGGQEVTTVVKVTTTKK
ncbi:hypothetical protein GCM10011416_19470 [Polaribacter pacificus]|uniref:GLPGLI family protein n=1 Tax=Polaribacter pacificus TaxID=1775173 RepID=A0A917I0I5_9FLAO|nr:hypothetical protein [Polaribacter pacificus]GGH00904.1 hypothetical protein GCM10011416_19470 [Polaribacter pacificus]